ncbi:hypothetical protein [Lysobacter gummosus]|uniref:hypothetical protein n=1 Tax=Lysobacter gummosus TaxID=262324 RepID=UPI00362C59E4
MPQPRTRGHGHDADVRGDGLIPIIRTPFPGALVCRVRPCPRSRCRCRCRRCWR